MRAQKSDYHKVILAFLVTLVYQRWKPLVASIADLVGVLNTPEITVSKAFNYGI